MSIFVFELGAFVSEEDAQVGFKHLGFTFPAHACIFIEEVREKAAAGK